MAGSRRPGRAQADEDRNYEMPVLGQGSITLEATNFRVLGRTAYSRRHGGALPENASVYDTVYTLNGEQVVVRPLSSADGWVPNPYSCCGGWFGTLWIPMLTLIGVVAILTLLIVGVCVGGFYVYPRTIELMRSEITAYIAMGIDLVVRNKGPLMDYARCQLTEGCEISNELLGPLLGGTFNCSAAVPALTDTCPLQLVGFERFIDQSTASSLLASTFSTDAPSFYEQLSILRGSDDSDSSPSSSS